MPRAGAHGRQGRAVAEGRSRSPAHPGCSGLRGGGGLPVLFLVSPFRLGVPPPPGRARALGGQCVGSNHRVPPSLFLGPKAAPPGPGRRPLPAPRPPPRLAPLTWP